MTFLTDIISFIQNEEPITSPVFLKEDDSADLRLQELRDLCVEARAIDAPADLVRDIERDEKLVEYGVKGERNLAFELKNSHLPLIVIHDLYLEHNGLTAQIDYLVISRRMIFVLECKNLYGDITINEKGNFIRGMQFGGRVQKEGIYSPITQLQRHLDLLRHMAAAEKNVAARAIFNYYFEDNYKSFVVLANPKTVLRDRYAPQEVKDKVIRADELVSTIARLEEESKIDTSTDRQMRYCAETWLSRASECRVDYLATNRKVLEEFKQASPSRRVREPKLAGSVTGGDLEALHEALRAHRYQVTKADGDKPYYMFSNAVLDDLVKKRPRTLDELRSVAGFGEKKCERYGEGIIKIVVDFSDR